MKYVRRLFSKFTHRVVQGRPWIDPALDRLVADVEDRRHAAPHRASVALHALGSTRGRPESQSLLTMALGERLLRDVDLLRAGAERPTGHPSTDADARALLAEVLTCLAWKVRGGGRGSGLSRSVVTRFRELLGEADVAARSALELDPAHAGAAVTRLATARGLGLRADEQTDRFDVARDISPTLFRAHSQMLQTVCAKWYGSTPVMWDFARSVARDAPPGDPVVAVLPLAHAEYSITDEVTSLGARRTKLLREARGRDAALVAAASDKWLLAVGPASATHPWGVTAHNAFGWYFRHDDPARSAEHLGRVAGRMSRFPWEYLGAHLYLDLPATGFRTSLTDARVRGA